jgi:hypothetical protein
VENLQAKMIEFALEAVADAHKIGTLANSKSV